MKKNAISLKNRVTSGFTSARTWVLYRVDHNPLLSFIVVLLLFVGLIALSNFIQKPKVAATPPPLPPKQVSVYQVGAAPKVRVQAQVEKSGVVTITALTGGVIQNIYHKEGEAIRQGATLVGLSSNYQGGNLAALQRQIAQTQYNNVKDTYDEQKQIIGRQRDLANTQNTQAADLRDITAKSISDTQAIIDQNSDILSTLDRNLSQLNASNSATTDNSQLILSTKELRSQFLSANSQLNQAQRNANYQSNSASAPAQLADISKDITLKQLDIQEKALDLNKEVSRLQVQVAAVTEAMMFPSAPFPGVVQRVFVKVGQAVQPGTPLMVLAEDESLDPIVAIAYVSNEMSHGISELEPSTLHIGTFTYDAFPSYVTQEAIQGSLYGVYFPIPDNYSRFVTEKGYIQIDLPIGYMNTSSVAPYLPLDAVYQTQSDSYIFVIHNGRAEAHVVELGQVFGQFVEVKSGLAKGDQVILDRNVINGDAVTAAH